MAYIDDEDWYIVREYDEVQIVDKKGASSDTIVRIPLDVFDAVALMRYAQLRAEDDSIGPLFEKMRAVCRQHPSLGAETLRRSVGVPVLLDLDRMMSDGEPSDLG